MLLSAELNWKNFYVHKIANSNTIARGLTISNIIEKTNLKAIDPETLKITKLSTKEDTFFVDLPLDRTPQEEWQELFEKELKKTAQPLAIIKKQKDTFPTIEPNFQNNLQGDTISIITNPKKLQEDIKLVMHLVETVNNRIDQHNKEASEQNEKENVKAEDNEETIREMRESLKKNPPTL